MLQKLRNRIKGQSTAEYAILIGLVVAAVIAMQTYAKRALQARVRDASVYMVAQTNGIGTTAQYEPYYLSTNFDVTRQQESNQILGNKIVSINGLQNVSRTGNQLTSYTMNGNGI